MVANHPASSRLEKIEDECSACDHELGGVLAADLLSALLSDLDSDLLSDFVSLLESEPPVDDFESDAADFLYDSLR